MRTLANEQHFRMHDHQRLRQVGNPTIGNGTDQDHRLAPEPRSRIPPRIQSPSGQLRHLETSAYLVKNHLGGGFPVISLNLISQSNFTVLWLSVRLCRCS